MALEEEIYNKLDRMDKVEYDTRQWHILVTLMWGIVVWLLLFSTISISVGFVGVTKQGTPELATVKLIWVLGLFLLFVMMIYGSFHIGIALMELDSEYRLKVV